MMKKSLKNIGIIAGLSLSLIAAGCGSDDTDSDADTDTEESYSAQMDYTITGIEPGAGQTETNEEVIAAYDNLEGWEQELSSTGAMLTALDEAISNEEPIIVSAWSPHYKFAQWDLKFLDDPQGIFSEDEVHTIAREGLQEDMPEAYTMLERMEWELEDIEAALLEALDSDFEEVAQNWVDENEDIVAEWADGVDEVDGTSIEIVLTPWDSETFLANVAKVVLEQQGFNVTLTPVDPAVLFESIASGDADASLAPWLPTTHGALYEQYEGEFEDLGVNSTGARIGLAVPAYMEIDSIEDLEPKE